MNRRMPYWVALYSACALLIFAGAARAGQLCFEDFKKGPGQINGSDGGGGFAAAWEVQSGNTETPGYIIANTSPLTYPNLLTSTNYATGGFKYVGCGRRLDPAGAFAKYLDGDKKVGKPGTTIWFSTLMRKDAKTDDPVAFCVGPTSVPPWLPHGQCVSVGYFGFKSTHDNKSFWSLRAGDEIKTGKTEVTVGTPVLLVTQITFGNGTDTVSLYVNPPLNGSSPATPDAQLTRQSAHFCAVSYYGGANAGNSSLSDIRFGESFADVTPAPTK